MFPKAHLQDIDSITMVFSNMLEDPLWSRNRHIYVPLGTVGTVTHRYKLGDEKSLQSVREDILARRIDKEHDELVHSVDIIWDAWLDWSAQFFSKLGDIPDHGSCAPWLTTLLVEVRDLEIVHSAFQDALKARELEERFTTLLIE
jgi:hypothetical protein